MIHLLMLLLTLKTDMYQPASILTEPTRGDLAQRLSSGHASPDEVMWYTVDALARDVKTNEMEKLVKVLEGSPYAEQGDPLVSACHDALIVHRGNNSWLFVLEILWVTLGSRQLDMVVRLYQEDWRFHLVRGVAHYWTPGNYSKISEAYNDLEFVFNKYLDIYGWDETLEWIRLWEGNLARRKGDISKARLLWQEVVSRQGGSAFEELAQLLLNETQAQ